jgi:YfiH family protein
MESFPSEWSRDGVVAGFGSRDAQPPASVVTVKQVHGTNVVTCDRLAAGEHRDVAADALVATRAGVLVGVKTADCVPILLRSPRTIHGGERWAAAVHAGWRGTAAGVIAAAVADATQRGHAAEELCAAVGPSIGACCYEVGDDVADTFRGLGLPVLESGPKPHLDLASIAAELLVRAGLLPENVARMAPCTRCNRDRYHSYRAFGPSAGRQVSWIGWTGPRRETA